VAKITLGLAAALIVLGLAGYVGSGMQSWTALIPAFFGIVFGILGGLALNPSMRKHAMHGAAVLGVLGLLGSFPGVIKAFQWMGGTPPARPAAIISQTIMAVLLIGFIILCVRSFIDARRQRTSGLDVASGS
jgi:hypothetical protein